jgi:hypothetical protein
VKQVVHVVLVSTSSPLPPPKKKEHSRAHKNVWSAGFSIIALKIRAIVQINYAALQIEIFIFFTNFVTHPLQQIHSYENKKN